MTPSAPVEFEDLLAAYEWVSSSPDDSRAFVSRLTGVVHWSSSTGVLDEELPEDIEDGRVYVAVPNKHDLNLGKNLALTFTEEELADSYQTVANIFRQRGAYGRFKDLLERKGLLQAWYDFEAKATERALREWAADEGISTDAVQPATPDLSGNVPPLEMSAFATTRLPVDPTVMAPDGSAVRILCGLRCGGMAHFELAAGQVARAVSHRTVEEIWYVVAGRGEMWRRQGDREETVVLEPGVSLTIPLGTHFQFRAATDAPVAAVAITMPPWPGESEAVFVQGPWPASA